MAKITEKDTKATILGALRQAEKKIIDLEKGKLKAEQETTQKKAKETITKADSMVEVSMEDKITDLTKSINQVLGKIGSDIAAESDNLQTIKSAIALKEAELKDLFGIEKQANTLAALVDAHQELKLAQENELVEAKNEATNKLNQIEDLIKAKNEEYQVLLKEQSKTLAQKQKREDEEFTYDFARRKKIENDKLADELASKRKEFEQELENKNTELASYKKSLDERQVEIEKREQKADKLEAEIEAFPAKLEETKKEADAKASAEIKRVLAIREAAMKREIEADKRILEAERDNLKTQLDKSLEVNGTLQAKLDEAYKRIQEMGIQMVSSSNESKAFDKIASLVTEKNSK
ncbi:hypothetical protein [Shimazuella alba]|uniref:Uncharacterized protein n=1 Tax=Shimazuella alba TaxID=2690964 RepID=A0A6I4VZD3_9BACL|nr:hypothetical protein [Shimazuella alba]MXQ55106.1 hypothetical protein [Shimazuella alba]